MLQHPQRGLGQEARAALLFRMVLHVGIDPRQQMLRQRGVEAHCLAKVGRHIEVDQRPHATGVVRVRRVHIDLLRLWQRLAIGDQPFEMQLQRLADILQRLGHGRSRGEATGHVRHGHPVVAVLLLVNHDGIFHVALPPADAGQSHEANFPVRRGEFIRLGGVFWRINSPLQRIDQALKPFMRLPCLLMAASFQAGLFQYALECSLRDLRLRVRNHHPSGLGWVLELMVTAFGCHLVPAIRLEQCDHLPAAHCHLLGLPGV
ncbi:hypothetical protein D3C78_1124010 [compost metagenome]